MEKPKFDWERLHEGQKRRDEGIQRVTENNLTFVGIARDLAVELAEEFGFVKADMVRDILEEQGIRPKHPNAWGAVFRGNKRLKWSGEFATSVQPQGHCNQQRIWVLAQGDNDE